MRAVVLVALTALAGCTTFDTAPAADVPAVCEAQVYADPHVKELLMKSAGSESFQKDHVEELKFAKVDATTRCLQAKGLRPPGGGVERPTVRN